MQSPSLRPDRRCVPNLFTRIYMPLRQFGMLKKALGWYLILLILCNFIAMVALIAAYRGPALSSSRRVLEIGSVKVDQFYSGLALSIILAPIAFLVRKVSLEIALLHPFRIASARAVSVADLERISDPGPLALSTMMKYSLWCTTVQSFLMLAGWLLVPIGTLCISTGSYMPQTISQAVVPMPTAEGSICPLSAIMNGNTSVKYFQPGLNAGDLFLDMASTVYKGGLLGRTNQLPDVPSEIGTLPHMSISFETGVTYQDIVSYRWSADCEDAGSEISYIMNQSGGTQAVTVAFPDGSTNQTILDWRNATALANMFMWRSVNSTLNFDLRRSITTYYAVVALANTSTSRGYDEQIYAGAGSAGITFDRGVWISRVKCQPKLSWSISNCTWDGTYMRNCIESPVLNSVTLDTVGLDALTEYMTAIPWKLYTEQDMLYSWNTFPGYAPTIEHFEVAYGIMALAITTIASMTSWGTASVRTVGESMREVYITRSYILIIIWLVLMIATTLGIIDTVYTIVKKKPFRKTTFLTIAKACRGTWWDEHLGGRLDMRSEKQNGSDGRAKVRFEADVRNEGYMGLFPEENIESERLTHKNRKTASVEVIEIDIRHRLEEDD